LIAYLDASAIVKLLLADEGGSGPVARVRDAADAVFTSRIAQPECRSALAAARRAGRLSAKEHAAAKRDLGRLLAQTGIIELDPSLAGFAGGVAETMSLRALDAVHLASALLIPEGSTILVSWDRQLADAATRSGLRTAPSEAERDLS
jgi:uncharacterized protein